MARPPRTDFFQFGREDVVERNLAHFHAADPDYGRRVAEAVRALRED